MTTIDVSVVVPAYNAEEFITDQLEAILAQRCSSRFEVVVADNGSSDGTVAVVQGLMRENSELSLVDASNVPGSAHARNVGVAEAMGAVIAFADADDVVDVGWLEAIVGSVCAGVIVTGPLLVDEINPTEVAGWRPKRAAGGLNTALGFLPFAPTSNLGILRDDYMRLDGLRENYPKSHDVEFSWRAQLSGMSLHFDDSQRIHYRYRSTLSGVFRQAVRGGRASAQLYSDYREHGLRAHTARQVLLDLRWLITRVPFVFVKWRRGIWIRRFGEACGRAIGSIKFRVLYL